MSKLEQLIDGVHQFVNENFDEQGNTNMDFAILASEPQRRIDIGKVFQDKPWLHASGKEFVRGMCEAGLEPIETMALLGSMLATGMLSNIRENELDLYADDLMATAFILVTAASMTYARHPDILAIVRSDQPEIAWPELREFGGEA